MQKAAGRNSALAAPECAKGAEGAEKLSLSDRSSQVFWVKLKRALLDFDSILDSTVFHSAR
ncbi:MAG: hypothetical protein JO000_16730, partial [Alphaproteobacteria bacterium]|nr:hypothetical protein [Alphaproteobacteria bacterium]